MIKKGVLTKTEKEALRGILRGNERIEKEANISWDGSNLLLRLPKEIADYLDINKSNRFEKKIKFILEETEEGVKKEFEVIKRDKSSIKKKNGKKKK